MLVLSRKEGERVVVADGELTIEVLEIRGDKVRLGFNADESISVHREEVWVAIQREGRKKKSSHPLPSARA